jgi:hypothetical protein
LELAEQQGLLYNLLDTAVQTVLFLVQGLQLLVLAVVAVVEELIKTESQVVLVEAVAVHKVEQTQTQVELVIREVILQ